jgi:hypothetical protein
VAAGVSGCRHRQQPNVLFIAVDDLNHWVAHLGRNKQVITPNKLLADPNAGWTGVAQSTHGFRNHAVRTAEWRYIRYANGDEELYDETKDPYKWSNLARDGNHAGVKAQLAKHFPKVDAEAGPRRTTARGNRSR